MLSTEMSFAPVVGLCPVAVLCSFGGESRASVISTVGPRLLFAVGALMMSSRRLDPSLLGKNNTLPMET